MPNVKNGSESELNSWMIQKGEKKVFDVYFLWFTFD